MGNSARTARASNSEEPAAGADPAGFFAAARVTTPLHSRRAGLRVGRRVARGQEAVARLAGVRLRGAGADEDLPVEDAGALPVEHALVELSARAAGRRVVDARVRVGVALARDDVEAQERGLR